MSAPRGKAGGRLTYRAAGVDIDSGDALVRRIDRAARTAACAGIAPDMESLLVFRRAGCDAVIRCFAPRAAALLSGGSA